MNNTTQQSSEQPAPPHPRPADEEPRYIVLRRSPGWERALKALRDGAGDPSKGEGV